MPANATADVQVLTINEDNLVRWDKVRRATDGTFVNTATGGWVLKDGDGAELASGDLTYVTSSSGRYHGVVDKTDSALLTEGATYYLEITLTGPAGEDGFKRITCVAAYND